MDDVISKLSEIEATASKIMDNVSTRKQELARQLEADTKAFDEETNNQIQKQLDDMRMEMETANDKQLKDLLVRTDTVISLMDTYYQENHLRLAKEIFEKMIRK